MNTPSNILRYATFEEPGERIAYIERGTEIVLCDRGMIRDAVEREDFRHSDKRLLIGYHLNGGNLVFTFHKKRSDLPVGLWGSSSEPIRDSQERRRLFMPIISLPFGNAHYLEAQQRALMINAEGFVDRGNIKLNWVSGSKNGLQLPPETLDQIKVGDELGQMEIGRNHIIHITRANVSQLDLNGSLPPNDLQDLVHCARNFSYDDQDRLAPEFIPEKLFIKAEDLPFHLSQEIWRTVLSGRNAFF